MTSIQRFTVQPDAIAIIRRLKRERNPKNIEGMTRFGINPKNTLGISVTRLRQLAREIGHDHKVALDSWKSGIHEARILASIVDIPEKVSLKQMDSWANDFDSWDIVDGCCGNLFDKTPYAVAKALEWSRRPEEFVRRAGFTMMAELAVHDKKLSDETFVKFLPLIIAGSSDDRNFVKKSVNWALRQIGKRNRNLHQVALKTAKEIAQSDSRSARWVASDAIRELTSESVAKRFS